MKIALGFLFLSLSLGAVLRSKNTVLRTPSADMRKKNAGPPSEFSMYTLPDPRTGGITSQSSLFPVTFAPSTAATGTVSWEGSVPVDSGSLVQFTLLTRLSDVKVNVMLPGSNTAVPIDVLLLKFKDQAGKVVEDSFGLGGDKVPSVTYWFKSPKQGSWTLQMTATEADLQRSVAAAKARVGPSTAAEKPHMFLMVFNESPAAADAYLASFEQLKQGSNVHIRANLWDTTYPRTHPSAVVRNDVPNSVATVSSVVMDLWLPDGTRRNVPMHDDGFHGDLVANDGVYGTSFEAAEVGGYIAEVVLAGTTKEGFPFLRNSLHSLNIVRSDLSVSSASVSPIDSERLRIELHTNVPVSALAEDDDVTHRAYAEVWGTSATGAMVPVCWLSGMTDLAPTATGSLAFDLELNQKWLTLAKASEPLELRNVYVQERNAWVPVSTAASLPVASEGVVRAALAARPAHEHTGPFEITQEMRKGVNPYANRTRPAARTDAVVTEGTGAKLLLVHGYCAPANNFPPEQFTDPVVFQDFNQNRPTDLFARLIKETGDQYDSFAIIAHSHGGLASTQLNAAYWSHLNVGDDGTKPLIQSVGSPYLGVPVSGLLAAVGSILGLGCGSIEDLTYDGARLWMAGVPAEQRKDTYYYTTQYETGHIINYCNIASNSVLKWPNDGITEVANNQFEGANNMGHKYAWCHSEGMHYPGQGKDPERNAYMNSHAKRA